MPKYFYTCTSCQEESSFYHDMNDLEHDCPLCDCTDTLNKKPSIFSLDAKKESIPERTGEVVKRSIEEFREDLKHQKNKLKSGFHESTK